MINFLSPPTTMSTTPATPSPTINQSAVPEEVLAEARRLVDLRFANCFWFWHPEATVDTWDDIALVIRHLREYGGRREWEEAQNLSRLLRSCR